MLLTYVHAIGAGVMASEKLRDSLGAEIIPLRKQSIFHWLAIGKHSIVILAQTFDSEKGQALRECTAQAVIHTKHKISKI